MTGSLDGAEFSPLLPVEAAADGHRIILNFDSLDAAIRLLSPVRDSSKRARVIESLHQALATAGLQLEVRVKGRSLVELGSEKIKGALLSLVGLKAPQQLF